MILKRWGLLRAGKHLCVQVRRYLQKLRHSNIEQWVSSHLASSLYRQEQKADFSEDNGSNLKEIAEYADKEKEKLAVKARIYSIAGICSMFMYGLAKTFGPADNIIFRLISSIAIILVYVALASSLIFTSSRLQTLQRKIKSKIRQNLVLIIVTVLIGLILLFTLVPMLMIGSM